MRKQIWALAGLLFIACLSGCGQGTGSGDEDMRPSVTVMEVKQEKMCIEKICDAILEMDNEQYICAQISGYVRQFYRSEGEQVRAGEQILLLENESVSLAVQRSAQEVQIARSQLEKTQARSEDARENMERMQQLYSQGAIARVEMEKSELEWQLLGHDLEQTQGQLEQAIIKQQESNLNSRSCEVSASDTLWLAEKMVSLGQYVNTGQAIFRAGKREALLIQIDLSRDEVRDWQVGDKLQVECQGEQREAVIKNINHTGKAGSNRAVIELRVENPQLDWFPGNTARVKYILGTKEQVVIPAQAIAGGDSPYVYILKDDRVYRQKVKMGSAEGAGIIVSGLEDGTQVVTGGLHRLRDGETVKVKEGR